MAAGKWTAEQIPSQAGKTALVTGANSGIGYQAALELARHGAHVLLACRNAAKGQAALARLQREAPGASAEVVELDMASLASIRAFSAAFIARKIPLDLLINNAGVMALPKRELTEDGFERNLGTNHLGHFALTGLAAAGAAGCAGTTSGDGSVVGAQDRQDRLSTTCSASAAMKAGMRTTRPSWQTFCSRKSWIDGRGPDTAGCSAWQSTRAFRRPASFRTVQGRRI